MLNRIREWWKGLGKSWKCWYCDAMMEANVYMAHEQLKLRGVEERLLQREDEIAELKAKIDRYDVVIDKFIDELAGLQEDA